MARRIVTKLADGPVTEHAASKWFDRDSRVHFHDALALVMEWGRAEKVGKKIHPK